MFRLKLKPTVVLLLFVGSIASSNVIITPHASALVRNIVFPVIGESSFVNDFYAPRGSQQHNAIDILAKKRSKLIAPATGTITDVRYPQPSWGYSVTVRDEDGFRYTYLHMNDDNPGTNDGKGGAMNAYAADMKEGNVVARGQLLGWVGDSGNSNGVPHLHFEMRSPGGQILNPYQSLLHATRYSQPKIPGRVTAEILPFGRYFSRGANIAMGNFDLDQASEFIISPGLGGSPLVNVYGNDDILVKDFLAFGSSFKGGIDVATGDVDGDGIDEIITAAASGSSRVRVFEADGTVLEDFYAYETGVINGLKVTAGDIDGDLKDEIIVGLAGGGEPRIKVFDLSSGEPVLARNFLAFSPGFRGGVDLAAGNVDPVSPFDEIVASTGHGGDPKVRVFASSGPRLQEFMVYPNAMDGGVRVSVGNVYLGSPEAEILTLPASEGNPQVKMYSGTGSLISSRMFIEEWWIGSYDIAAGYDFAKGITGTNRRVSARLGIN